MGVGAEQFTCCGTLRNTGPELLRPGAPCAGESQAQVGSHETGTRSLRPRASDLQSRLRLSVLPLTFLALVLQPDTVCPLPPGITESTELQSHPSTRETSALRSQESLHPPVRLQQEAPSPESPRGRCEPRAAPAQRPAQPRAAPAHPAVSTRHRDGVCVESGEATLPAAPVSSRPSGRPWT